MISEAAVQWGLNIYALVGIIFFIVIGIVANFFSKDRAKEDPLLNQKEQTNTNQNQYEDDEKKALIAQGMLFQDMMGRGSQIPQNLNNKLLFTNQSIVDQIHKVADIYFIRQSTFMLAFALGAWLIFFASFSAQFSIFWSLISLLYGLVVVAIVSFIALKLSINIAVRFLNESLYSRGKAYSFGWQAGAAISAGVVCLTLFIFNDLIELSSHFILHKEEHLTDQDKQLGFYFTLMGFVWGVFSGVFFYRQIGLEVGKGLTNGSDMLGSERVEHIFQIQNINDEIIQQGKIFGNIISTTLTGFLDYTGILCLLIVIFGLLISQSKEIVATGDQGVYYFPSYAILLCVLFQVILTVLAYLQRGIEDQDQITTPATFTAKNNILQVILCNVASALVLIFIPLYFFPKEEFSIGSQDYPAFYYDKITSYSLVWCGEIGLITQSVMIFIGELFTSNAFRSTKEVALEQMKNPGYGQTQVFTMCSFAQGFILITLGVSIMLCYLFGGFLGIAVGLVGILSNPILLGTITIFGVCSQDAAILSRLSNFGAHTYYNCRNMAKGAMNYLVYLQITTAVAVFFIDIILIGLTGYLGKIKDVEIWDSFTLLGIFLGGALAYILKASSNNTINDIAKPIGKGQLLPEDIQKEDDYRQDHTTVEYKAETFQDYIVTKFASKPVIKIIINLVGSFTLILVLAYLFGGKVVLGYITGLNIFGVHIVLYSILLSNAAKNARHFNQDVQLNKDHHQRNISGLQNSIICDIATSTCENNGILAYLLINSLFVMMGALQYWETWGKFGNFLESDRSSITEIATSFWDWFIVGE